LLFIIPFLENPVLSVNKIKHRETRFLACYLSNHLQNLLLKICLLKTLYTLQMI